MRAAQKNAGFSLIEMLLVITIMGIFAAMAIPNAAPSLHDQLEGAAQTLAGDIAYTRNLSVANNSSYSLTFDLVNNQYILKYAGTNSALSNLPASPLGSPGDPPTQQSVKMSNLPHLGGTVQLYAVYSLATPAQSVTSLQFGPLGQTTSGASTVIWFAAGSGTATRYLSVVVNPVTGLTWIQNFQAQTPTLAQGTGS